tara:strand:+ start:6014 stop:6901 length:888 start_codon:yes stop_codon:yes gene_type:complete
MSWDNYISSIQEAGSYKKRIRSYIKDRNKMLKKGGQKNTPPYTQAMGTHVTFDKQLEEVEESSFDYHNELQPDIWRGDSLDEEVRARLLEIAEDFLEGFDMDIVMEDLRFTGSLANYNWSKYSDIDLHLVVEFSKINNDTEIVKAFFDEARMRWNDKHRIMIRGFEVEIYVEDTHEEHKSSGIYSILREEWINKPSPGGGDIDFDTAQKKAHDYVRRAGTIERLVADKKYELALTRIDRTKEKIRDMRKAGLESEEAEFSAENIAFKILRRDGILKLLSHLKTTSYDRLMTLKEE